MKKNKTSITTTSEGKYELKNLIVKIEVVSTERFGCTLQLYICSTDGNFKYKIGSPQYVPVKGTLAIEGLKNKFVLDVV